MAMMKILERYIAKAIMMATGLTALVITGILFLISLLNELKNVGEGDYGFYQALFYVCMRMPSELYQFSPMLILLGSITGLSILSAYREIIVMRVSGFSIRQIILSVITVSFMLILAIGLIGEGVAPKLSNLAETYKENDRNAGQAVVTTAGIWLHVDNNFIHIEHVVGHHLLEGVTRYQFDSQHHLQSTYYAKTLSYQNHQWIMNDVVKTTFYQDRTQSQAFSHSHWDVKFNPNLLNVGLIDPSQMTLPGLAKFAAYLEQNGLQANEYRYEFWQRVFQPLASLVMIFLAIPFVLGTLRASSLGFRLVVGILVGFAFFISNAFLGQVCVVYQVPAILAAFLPLFIFAIVGIFLSQRLLKQ